MMNENCSNSMCPDISQCQVPWKVSYNGDAVSKHNLKSDQHIILACKGNFKIITSLQNYDGYIFFQQSHQIYYYLSLIKMKLQLVLAAQKAPLLVTMKNVFLNHLNVMEKMIVEITQTKKKVAVILLARIINVFTMMQSVMVLMIVEISVTKKIAKVIQLVIKI